MLASYSKSHELLSKIDFPQLIMAPSTIEIYHKSAERDSVAVVARFYQASFTKITGNDYYFITKGSLE